MGGGLRLVWRKCVGTRSDDAAGALDGLVEDLRQTHILAGTGLHDLPVLAEYAPECDVLEIALNAHHFCRRENLLEMEGLWGSYDIPDGFGMPVRDPVIDRGKVCRGIEETSIAFTDDGRLVLQGGNAREENAECAFAGGCDSLPFECGAEGCECIVVGAFAKAFVEADVEKVVEFLEFPPREFDGLFPDGEVLGIAGLKFHQLLASCALDDLIGFLQAGDFPVKAHEFGDGILSKSIAVEEMLPPVDDLTKLCAPVPDMVVGDDLMPEKSCDTHQAIAKDRAANVADMHRLRHIGRAEIHKDFSGAGDDIHPQSGVCGKMREGFGEKGILESEVDKPRSGDLWLRGQTGYIDMAENFAGQFTRIRLFFFSENHGSIGLVVAKARVARL